ncbi:MAG: M20/M25/M40 family metallo-hydrolase [Acidobacteria bacterium]|nr:M20/M25/M40 family metallo-hydrolase [Acidobacteriota bacterium]
MMRAPFPISLCRRIATGLSAAGLALAAACTTEPSEPATGAAQASIDDAAARWFGHVEMLADDSMRGRETGSPEHRKAADYVATRFQRAGLEPAGTAGYLQPIALRSRRIVEATSSLALVRRGKAEPVTLGEEATFGMRIDPAPSVEAPLVFAGHALQIPEVGHDDFAGLDVQGKVVVYLSGSPSNVPGALSAHYQSAAERWSTLKRLGAIGTIGIADPKSMDVPWERSSPNRLNPAMALGDASLDDTAGQQVSIAFNPAKAERLFEGSGRTFADILKAAGEGKALPRFALPSAVRATVTVENLGVESHNVAGIVRGSDPRLANEFVVLTAHLDHVGAGAAIDGDDIYNGAMDNASGVATLIEAASAVAAARPKRSVVFVAVTAEEKGLLGSRYYARNPTVERDAIVANINMDMFLPLFPFRILMVLGLDESDLGDDVRALATEMGIAVQADPEPQRNRFIRSDQYSFIREGVPALAMKVGYEAHTPEATIAADWTRERYHAPSDDLAQPFDRSAAVGFTDMIGRLAVRVANRDTRPSWKADSFFRRFARPAAVEATGR